MNTLTGYVRQAATALRFLVLATVVLGGAYPLAVFGAGQLVASSRANGSLIYDAGGRPAASALLAQVAATADGVQDPAWFHARPSAANWDPAGSSASNLGPNEAKLQDGANANRNAVAAAEGVAPGQVPADAVTTSGSGLDPQISVDYAMLQVPRVARAHGLPEDAVRSLVEGRTGSGVPAFLGQPSVNVTLLNLDVAAAAGSK
ncbi:potassium-transporting ATPase subunit C [Paenarthrobacter sp. NPDC089675]|uniref:potassium-transporting ATPase subunit C n=1 Tax=Paenarthrobacter sp. NPDC089675 TaxID=3364376 RepID=UPI0037F7F7FB